MNAVADARGGHVPLLVRETRWGFVFRSEAPGSDLRELGSGGARFVRLACWAAAAGLVLWPMLRPFAEQVLLKGALLVALLALCEFVVAAQRRGRGRELQLDRARRMIRLMQVTACGETRVDAVVAFAEVNGVVLGRGQARGERRLCLRLRGSRQLLTAAEGAETVLRGLRDRISREICAANGGMRGADGAGSRQAA